MASSIGSLSDAPDFDQWLAQIENGNLDVSSPSSTSSSQSFSHPTSSPIHDLLLSANPDFSDNDVDLLGHLLAPSIPPATGVPMATIPVELLIIVFTFCIADDPDIAAVLARVCRQWRAVLLELPALWQRLRLSDMHFDSRLLRAKASLWLSRTRHLPLDLDFDTRHRDSILPLLSYTLPAADRWRNISYLHSRMRFVTVADGGEPCLESLMVTMAPKKSLASDLFPASAAEQSPTMRTWWGGRDLPHTREFKSSEERLREIYVLGIRSLPPPETLNPFNTVTNLVLMNASTECDFPMHQAAPFLTAFPNLEVLELSNFNELFLIHDPEYRPDCRALQPAQLTKLRKLIVRGICSSRCVLSHIRAPRLRSLHLVHINSSGVFAHPTENEPGDSEDEARDFSRSPWTDHATGMGLRKFFGPDDDEIEESGPPLKELVMDYADLRTKDFRWLFARLQRLEKFIIVASDLSDNVLRALSSPHPDDILASIHARENGMDMDMDVVVPVPRLSKLKMSKCQKLSGDAVVRMVRSRAVAAERGLVVPFEELTVSECVPVKEMHHQMLQQLLPQSARLVYAPAFEED